LETEFKINIMKYIFLLFTFLATFQLGFAQASFFNILEYGAINDGRTINTKAIQKAIDACATKGGGTVYFPAGKYISGTLFLKNNIILNLESGAILEGSKNISDYPVTISEIRSYTDNYTNKSLIYGEGLEYIGITGHGIIDGNGEYFKVSDESEKRSLFDSYKARPFIIRIINCKNILVKDITLKNSAMWVQHYLSCRNVIIDGITVSSRVNHNNDGIDIDACDNVRISNCDIISGDDAIVIKSTLDKPCKNITITNCMLSSKCNAFKLGTESNGDFLNISLSNCIIYDTGLAGIALEMVDGGSLNNVSVTDVNMDNVECPIFIRLGNRARPFKKNMAKPGMGRLFNVIISSVQATNVGKIGCSITGLPLFPAMKISLNNLCLTFKGGGTENLTNREIKEFPEKYPSHDMFGTLPAYGFFCRHITGLTLDNIELSYEEPDYRPALFLSDVSDSRISDMNASGEERTKSLIVIDSSKNIIIRDCNVLKETSVLASIKNGSSGISFINNSIFNTNELYISDGSIDKSDIIVR
jgi:glycosyl hydrolase family 28